MSKAPMKKIGLNDHACKACGNPEAPWGFHNIFYCTEHKAIGKAQMASSRVTTPVGIGSPAVIKKEERQGKLL